ncbi:MAG TPA: hypothetical protein ENH10_00805, partial [Bacteroidetes bacterium]|nr:hypothetical protein [Bacteroidota bacterium]HEX03683.1 hypothetical protein [Bacteroidota bacterium]
MSYEQKKRQIKHFLPREMPGFNTEILLVRRKTLDARQDDFIPRHAEVPGFNTEILLVRRKTLDARQD